METIIDRLFHKRHRAEADESDCSALHYPVERTGCEPPEGEAAPADRAPREDAASPEPPLARQVPLARQAPLLPRQEPRLKLPYPAKREISVEDFPTLNLNRETVEILKDDKIATGG